MTGYIFRFKRNNEFVDLDLSEATAEEIREFFNTKSREFVIETLIGVLGNNSPTPQESQFDLAK